MGVKRHIKRDENSCYIYCDKCGRINDNYNYVSYDEIFHGDRGVSRGWYDAGSNSNINLCPECYREEYLDKDDIK